jgi:hypothetical protein
MKGLLKGFLGLCLLVAIATLLPMSQALAQSGVLSGPPQVRPTTPGPQYGPNPYGQGPGMPPPGPRVQGPAPGYGSWIAVVAGFDGTGKRVSVGYSGVQRSKYEAEDAAIRACNRVDRRVFCQNPFAVSTGCLYIVPGNKRSGGVRWGRGGTPEIAFAECGYVCLSNKLIGGCVSGGR